MRFLILLLSVFLIFFTACNTQKESGYSDQDVSIFSGIDQEVALISGLDQQATFNYNNVFTIIQEKSTKQIILNPIIVMNSVDVLFLRGKFCKYQC